MGNENSFEQLANHRLQLSGFNEKSLSDLNLPEVQRLSVEGTSVSLCYIEMGNTPDAETVVFSVIPYSTHLKDESIKVRLAAQQLALGPDTALVGVQVYEPKHQEMTENERKTISDGSFEPFADKLLMTIEALDLRDDQQIGLYGFSMGADVVTEAAHNNLFNVNRGIALIERLGVFEPARVQKRGAIAVIGAFAGSGKELYKNVIESRVPALLEARNINLDDKKAEKKHAAAVNIGVAKYNLADISGNIALVRGFGHDNTVRQLNAMSLAGISNSHSPDITVARMMDSSVTPREALAMIRTSDTLKIYEYAGDHSAADNVRRSAAFIIQTASA